MPIDFKDYIGQPCRARAAFEFIPKKNVKLDMPATAIAMKRANFILEADTPVILIVKVDEFPVSIFKNGKILVRETKDCVTAELAVEKIRQLIEVIT